MSFKKKLILLFMLAILVIALILGTIIFTVTKDKKADKKVAEQNNTQNNSQHTETFEDHTSPIIILDDTYIVNTGYDKNLVDVIMSADDIDPNPKREIIGEYDVTTAGEYNLIYKITDNSGNVTTKEFTLKVRDNYTYTDNNKISFKDAINTYKTPDTKLGIDVSKWQEEIDWGTVAGEGVEFAIIRMGYQNGFDGDVLIDPYFEQNVKGCQENRNSNFNLFFFLCQIYRRSKIASRMD